MRDRGQQLKGSYYTLNGGVTCQVRSDPLLTGQVGPYVIEGDGLPPGCCLRPEAIFQHLLAHHLRRRSNPVSFSDRRFAFRADGSPSCTWSVS